MPQRQLNVRSDEAFSRGSSVARRLGTTTADVVVEALRVYEDQIAPRNEQGLTAVQQRDFEDPMELSREVARHKMPGATWDHSDVHDVSLCETASVTPTSSPR